MKRNILMFGCIICCFVIIFSFITINGIAVEEPTFLNNGNPRFIAFRFYLGEAHNFYFDDNISGFSTHNCLELRIWKYWDMNDNYSGISFRHNKGNYTFGFGYGWKFYGIMREGFICGVYFVYGEYTTIEL